MTDNLRVMMPRLGESIVEATIARWRVKPGDPVERGQIVAEVETDKATNELPAPAAGVVVALLVNEGATVAVGTPILEITGRREDGKVLGSGSDRLPAHHLAEQGRGGPARSSPAVRRLAREHALDLNAIAGSGKNGRVTRDDVLKSLDKNGSAPPPIAREEATPFTTALPHPIAEQPASEARSERSERSGERGLAPSVSPSTRGLKYTPKPGDKVVPFSRRRSQIAQHMLSSLQTSAHVFALAEIDMARVIAAKNTDAPLAEKGGLKLTFMPYVIAAVARALSEHPELNATVSGESLVLRAEKNIGVAVDTPEGLVVPVIRRANELGVLGIARQLAELSERARNGKLSADDISSGSFTISNPGRDGNLVGLSIIRQPEVAILRMGSIVKRPVVREIDGEDAIVVRPMMFAALSYDHRVIDGRAGNAFLSAVSDLIAKTKPSLGA